MAHRTLVVSSFDDYLKLDYLAFSEEGKAFEIAFRNERLKRFPYSVVLQVSFAELDFANRWCWQNIGPSEGECLQQQSEYPACRIDSPHSHLGKWIWVWIEKTEYNFGFNEWCFSAISDQEKFLAELPRINWGEHYPK